MALSTHYKFITSITSKVFQNVTYICFQKLATDSTQLSNKGKSSPPKDQQKDVTGLSSSVYTTPSHDPNHESNRIASPDPNSPSSISEYGNENSNTITKETVIPDTEHMKNQALLNLPQQNKDITPPLDMQKFVAGYLPQNVVDSFYSKSSKTEVNIGKESTKLPNPHDNKLLLMSVELGMIPESVQLLCSELTPCKPVSKVNKVHDADSINNLITNIEEQCKLLNGVCENDYKKLFLIALELGSIPQGLQTFFNEHFFVNNTKLKENDSIAEEFMQLTDKATREKFSVGVTSILSLLCGNVPRIFDEYLNMSNSVNDNIHHTISQDTHYLHKNEAQNDIFGKTPSSAQSIHEADANTFGPKVSAKGNHYNRFTNFYSNTADTIESTGNENAPPNTFTNFYSNTADTIESIYNKKNASALESFPLNQPLSELPRDIIKAKGVFGMPNPRYIKQVGDPNHEISPKMTNPAPKSRYSIITEENAIGVGQPSPSIQPEETCKHCLLSAQRAPGVVKEVPIIFSQPHIDNDLTPPLTEYEKSSTESKLKNVKKAAPEQSEELTHLSNVQNMKLCLLTAELGILTKRTITYSSKLSSCPPITSPKVSTLLEQQEFSNEYCLYNLFLVMLECGILPVGLKTVAYMNRFEKCYKSPEVTKDLSVNYTHKPESMKIKHALIPWKSAPNALMIYKKVIPVLAIAPQAVTVNISELIKSINQDLLQIEKLKECLHIFEIPLYNEDSSIFEIPLYNEDSSEISTVEEDTDAHLCVSKTSNLSKVYGMNTIMVVPANDVQQDNVSINIFKNIDLCNEALTSKSCSTMPAGRMEEIFSHYKSHIKNSDNLPIPYESTKLELEVLNYRGTVDNMKSQTGPHRNIVKVEDGQIQAHERQETEVITQRATITLNKLKTLPGSEIRNTSEYLHLASHILNPERKVQDHTKSKLSVKSVDLTVSSGHTNDMKSNVMEKESPIVLPDQTVMLPIFNANETLTIFCNVGKEKADKNFVSPEKTVMLPVLDTNDTLSISCNAGKEEINNKNVVSPALDAKDPLSFSCNAGKEKVINKNDVSPIDMSPELDTKDTLSISCNVGKEKVESLISDENVSAFPDTNIVSIFYTKLCTNSKNSDSDKQTNKHDTVSSNHDDGERLNFTNKAQRSIEAIIKAVRDKYNNSVNKLSAHYTSKSDDSPPNTVETSDFHMGDIFKEHIWKPITLNIWKVFDYLNNMNLHKASTNLDLKRDFPQKIESCAPEIYQKLDSQSLLTQINKSNAFMISKYKYLSELCPEPFATYPTELESINKEEAKLHHEICLAEVTGPSSSVLVVCDGEVGPGASKSGEYKNPEYFSYHKESYFEAEVEMLKYRLPQPSSQEK